MTQCLLKKSLIHQKVIRHVSNTKQEDSKVRPKMDGKQVIDEIMKINPNQTIIMITGFPQEVTNYLGFSHVKVFLKPFDPDDLITMLGQLDSDRRKPIANIITGTEAN